MGQAFDRDGNVLGEASGETKREVFEKLSDQFKDAHEIRIRSVGPDIDLTPREVELLSGERMLQFFHYEHLPEAMRNVSRPFCELAKWLVLNTPRNAERSAGLRKLLEAKDCAVRAVLEGA